MNGLTLEERLNLAARSEASSREAAAKLVRKFSALRPALLFDGKSDLDRLCGLAPDVLEMTDIDIEHYAGFVRVFQTVIRFDNPTGSPGFCSPYRPVWGVRSNNTVILLGLMLSDHLNGRASRKEIYRCLRMTFGQYLNALEELSPSFCAGKDSFPYSVSRPLSETLTAILRDYINSWKLFDRIRHVLGCIAAANECLEIEETEGFIPYSLPSPSPVPPETDPVIYYDDMAHDYHPDTIPDPGDDLPKGAIREEIFLYDTDYTPETLRARAMDAPTETMRTLLMELASEENIAATMREVNRCVTDLYRLFVEPYLNIENPIWK